MPASQTSLPDRQLRLEEKLLVSAALSLVAKGKLNTPLLRHEQKLGQAVVAINRAILTVEKVAEDCQKAGLTMPELVEIIRATYNMAVRIRTDAVGGHHKDYGSLANCYLAALVSGAHEDFEEIWNRDHLYGNPQAIVIRLSRSIDLVRDFTGREPDFAIGVDLTPGSQTE